jgi:hypothetical protein
MISEEQLAGLMRLAGKHNITIYQEMERNRYVLRGNGDNIGKFFTASEARTVIIDGEAWTPQEIAEQLAGRPLLKFAFQDLLF